MKNKCLLVNFVEVNALYASIDVPFCTNPRATRVLETDCSAKMVPSMDSLAMKVLHSKYLLCDQIIMNITSNKRGSSVSAYVPLLGVI